MHIRGLVAACAVCFGSVAVAGNTWYVDAANYGKTGMTGLDWQHAYGTIQAAIDAETTQPDDVIEVKPGIYDQGVTTDSLGSKDRVRVTKKLTIRSSDGKRDSVEVLGAWTVGGEHGIGADSIRCIGIETDAAGSVIQGFVLRGGATDTGSDSCAVSGGGIVYLSPTKGTSGATYLVDSTITGCSATRGGANRGIAMVRCLITDCYASFNYSAFRQAKAFNCIFYNNSKSQVAIGYNSTFVNCTVYGDLAGQLTDTEDTTTFVNSIFIPSASGSVGAGKSFSHCATTAGSLAGEGNQTGLVDILVGPAIGDVRLRSTSEAVGIGDVAALKDIPIAYRDTDFYGNPRTTTVDSVTTVNPGAVEPVGVPVAGKMSFDGITCSGQDCRITVNGNPVWSSYLYPTEWPMQVQVGVEKVPTGFAVLRYDQTLGGDSFAARTPPSIKDDTLWLMPHPTKTRTVKPNLKSFRYAKAANYGKAGLDGKTEETAYGTIQDAIDSGYQVIKVLPGVYDKGGKEGGAAGSEMSNRVYLATANVRIVSTEGAEKTFIVGAADPDFADGIGPAAVRCAYFNGVACPLQGFTLTGSHPKTKGDLTQSAFNGGGKTSAGFLADSIVSNNYGAVAGLYTGTAVRTLFAENHSDGSTSAVVIRYALAANCIFRDNTTARSSHNDASIYNCTVYEKNLTEGSIVFAASGVKIYNTIYSVAGDVSANQVANMGGCVFHGGTYANGKAGSYVTANPNYAWEAAGDYRLMPGSPALGAGVTGHDDFSSYATGDFYGNPYVFTDGKPAVGAVHTALPRATRYVATNGDDANDGLSAETPKATLAAALAEASPLDTVRVAPGEYATGSAVHPFALKGTDAPTVPARAMVPARVALEATGSAADTVIVGGNGVRCVVLNAESTLRGFTLRGGRTGTVNAEKDDNVGGGVLAADSSSVSEDCLITDCAAIRGGGSYRGTFRRCRFDGCSATVNGAASRQGYYYGCLFDNNVGPDDVAYPAAINGCTFGAGTRNGSGEVVPSVSGDGCKTVNTLILSAHPSALPASAKLVSCAYPSTLTTVFATAPVNPVVAAPENLQVDASGRPVVGANAAIDAADETLYDASVMGAVDLSGFQRILNAHMDIGALEANWLPTYAKTLGNPRDLTVTSAPSLAERVGKTVVLPTGVLSATLDASATKDFLLSFHVTGTGVLTLTVDGAQVGSWTKQDGPVAYSPILAGTTAALAFSYEPGTEDDGAAVLDRLARNSGLMLLFR